MLGLKDVMEMRGCGWVDGKRMLCGGERGEGGGGGEWKETTGVMMGSLSPSSPPFFPLPRGV